MASLLGIVVLVLGRYLLCQSLDSWGEVLKEDLMAEGMAVFLCAFLLLGRFWPVDGVPGSSQGELGYQAYCTVGASRITKSMVPYSSCSSSFMYLEYAST